MGNQKDTSGPVPGTYMLGQIVELARFAPAILDQFPVVIVRTDCHCPRGLQARPSGLESSARGNCPGQLSVQLPYLALTDGTTAPAWID
jgi:hypothetical protein